jgi:aminomethyltransferase
MGSERTPFVRVSPLKQKLVQAGGVFRDRHGVEVVSRFTDRRLECAAVRESAALADFSFARCFRFPEDKGIDFLDLLLAGQVPKIRFGRLLHTFLADNEGFLLGDCYVANHDTEFFFICESILPDAQLDALLATAGLPQAGGEDLTTTHVLLSLDGCLAWQIVKKVFGADVLGLPYLSIEDYLFEGQPVRLLRAGKTSEFGYLLLVEKGAAEPLFDLLRGEVEAVGGRLCGVDAHDDLRLEGRFFNIQQEGQRVRDPLTIGLQWMIDFEKEKFSGCAAIKQRRLQGLKNKLIGVAAEPGCDQLKQGARIYHQGSAVATVEAEGFSGVLKRPLGLAVFPVGLAYSGLSFRLEEPDGPEVRSISMPPIMPKSLTVKLDEM